MRAPKALVATIVSAVVALGAMIAPPAHASTQTDFIGKLVAAAQQTQRERGIPASVTIGMAALETGWGRSSMAKDPINTLFNIKCTSTKSPYQKGCVDVSSYEYRSDGSRYLKVSSFRTYASTGDSLKDFGLFLTKLSRYAKAFNHKDDPDAFVREVHRAGYATDPRYTELVTGIMKSYNLYRYDVPGQVTPPADPIAPKPANPTSGAPKEFTHLSFGAHGGAVYTVQRLLNAQQGAGVKVTGQYDVATQAAIADYQYESMKLAEISGETDRDTWLSLIPTLRRGDRGLAVTALQSELGDAGYKLERDGVFGAATLDAVQDFQRRQGLPTTGVAAQMTWGRLLGM